MGMDLTDGQIKVNSAESSEDEQTLETVSDDQTDDISQVEGSSEEKSKDADGLDFVQNELYNTLVYVNGQLTEVDHQTGNITRFSRNVYEVKKMLVEQKLGVLKQMSSIAFERRKQSNEDKEATDITDLLGK